MAHKTLVGGTAYGITGGKCLVGGTGYSISKGRTLVGGTGYDIALTSVVMVTITGTGNSSYCYATIDGWAYTTPASGIEVVPGDVISFYVGSSWARPGSLTIDEETTDGGDNATGPEKISWVVPQGISNVAIVLDISESRAVITVATS